MIEHLPNELRDRFTEMREIDLGVENTVDNLEARYLYIYQVVVSVCLSDHSS